MTSTLVPDLTQPTLGPERSLTNAFHRVLQCVRERERESERERASEREREREKLINIHLI